MTSLLVDFRSVLRVLPVWWQISSKQQTNRKGEFHYLDCLREALHCGLAIMSCYSPTKSKKPNIRILPEKPNSGVMNKFSAEYYSLKALKNLAERTSENDTKSKELGISQLVIKVAQEETAFATGVHAQIWDDALAASDMSDLINREKATAKDLVTSTLWEEEPPKWFQSNWPSSQTARDEWSFWVEWYQGFLDGKPLDWELQYRLSLINDAIWEAGPEAVAKEIEKVRAKFDLGNRVAELETDLRRVMVNRHGIGGNMPPEILDDRHITQEMVIFPQPIEDLKDEIAKDDLDPKRLQKIIDALVAALKEGVAWCLRKGDLIVDTAIKWAIPTGGTGYIALNPEKLEAVIEAAKKLLSVH